MGFALVWLTGSAAGQIIQPIYCFTNSEFSSPRNLLVGLTPGPDGCLYGMTYLGGSGGWGTVFRVTTSGVLTVIANLDSNTGGDPNASLTLGPDGNFYGTTSFLGTGEEGTVFQVTTNGAVNVLFAFQPIFQNGTEYTNLDGAAPHAGLTLGPDGCFYGSTTQGGMNGGGTIFKITTNGVLTTLVTLGPPTADTNAPGASPHGRMALGPDGNFYGTTWIGGNSGEGTVFEMTTNGAYTTLLSFDDTDDLDGSEPDYDLVLGPDQCFYGTTYVGGSGGDGTVFKLTTNGVLSTSVNFAGTNGGTPMGGVTIGPDGYLYGTFFNGSTTNGDGGVFRMTTNGTLTVLADFGGTNGYEPEAPLTVGPDGNLYGTTYLGGIGTNAAGVIYRVNIAPTMTNQQPRILMSANGTAILHLASAPGSTNRLWATTNLSLATAQWQVLATNIATNGFFDFQDSNTSGSQMKFYRLSTP